MMENNYLTNIIMFIGCFLLGICAYGMYESQYQPITTEPEVVTEYVYIEKEPEVVTETVYVPCEMDEFVRNLSDDDKWCLCDMGMRESENQGVTGHCWVMYTMLCRCEAYGMTIREVWESDAFSSSMSRTGKTPNEDCLKALALIEEGWTPKPLWFRRSYYHNFGNPLCQYGDHCFSYK